MKVYWLRFFWLPAIESNLTLNSFSKAAVNRVFIGSILEAVTDAKGESSSHAWGRVKPQQPHGQQKLYTLGLCL